MTTRSGSIRWHRRLSACGLLFLAPASAHAHVPISNIGDLGNGAAHPLVTPTHLLILLGLSLWIGQHPGKNLKPFGLVFVPLTAIALAFTLTRMVAGIPQPILVGIALCVAALVVFEKSVPGIAAGILFGVAAVALGLDSTVEGGITAATLKTLLGTWSCLNVVIFSLSFYVSLCTKEWLKVGVRVLGSWIIAISLLMLAFSFRK